MLFCADQKGSLRSSARLGATLKPPEEPRQAAERSVHSVSLTPGHTDCGTNFCPTRKQNGSCVSSFTHGPRPWN